MFLNILTLLDLSDPQQSVLLNLCCEVTVMEERPFRCPSKSLFNTHSTPRQSGWEQTTRDSARKSMAPPFRLTKAQTKGSSAGIGRQWKAGRSNECSGAGEAMNYAAAGKSSFIKVFWKRSHFRTVRVSIFCFSETPCLFDTLSSF